MVHLRGVKVDAVGTLHLTVHQTIVDILVVGFRPLFVIALDASTARRVIAGSRQADAGFVGEVKLSLHQPFTERAASNDSAAVVILDSARHNLAGRCAEVIDQNHDLALLEIALASGENHLRADFCPFNRDNLAVVWQEFVADADGRIEETAAVASQIDNQVRHALPFQFQDGIMELVSSRAAELVQFDVAGFAVNHIGHVHGVSRNHPAGNFVGVLVLEARTQNADLYFRTFLTT